MSTTITTLGASLRQVLPVMRYAIIPVIVIIKMELLVMTSFQPLPWG